MEYQFVIVYTPEGKYPTDSEMLLINSNKTRIENCLKYVEIFVDIFDADALFLWDHHNKIICMFLCYLSAGFTAYLKSNILSDTYIDIE